MLEKKVLSDIVEWDIYTWSKGILYWDATLGPILENPSKKKVLDLGARNGGTSLFFALKGLNCTCSDIHEPSEQAKTLHKRYGVSDLVRYECVDCTNIDFPDNTFDIVAFKSVMGSVGANNNFDNIEKAFDEIYRVLKPGGVLLFCENLQGAFLHMFLRKRFIRWSRTWNYLTLDYMNQSMGRFSEHSLHTYGFLNCMIKDNSAINWFDSRLCRRLKPQNQYMCYGHAQK
ncbi:MAG: class I SAM-dependent methyltransferase [Peptococcaceae bacterium]|nr:class I SAM-dependent methyltransferase [Peptococcaceae bacterium]